MTHLSVEKFKLKLKPVTPIHVYSGETATIGIDAFVYNNDLFVISHNDLAKLEPEDLKSIDDVLSKDVHEVFRRVFDALRKKGAVKPVATVKTPSKLTTGQVRLMHYCIIPGSTLKGYIRTALLRRLLSEMSQNERSKLFTEWIDLGGKPAWMSLGVEAKVFRKPRPRGQGGALDVLDSLLVSDPRVKEVDLAVRELVVVHKDNPSQRIASIIAVVMEPTGREALEYELTIAPTATHLKKEAVPEVMRELADFRRNFAKYLSKRELLEALRQHGCRLIDIELNKVHQSLVDYRKLLEDLKRRLCMSREVACAPARLGFMTGHEAKTVLDMVKQDAPQKYTEVVRRMSENLGRLWDATTLKLVVYDGRLMGVGWCEICVE